jgi:hypothetical protein
MIKEFLIDQGMFIQSGEILVKGKSNLIIAASISPLAFILEQISNWSITNGAYILFVFAAIMLDHILGTLIHLFVKRDFTIKKNVVGLVMKLGLVIAVGLLFEGINHIVVGENFIKDYLTIVLRLLVFMYPAGSAFMNSSIITNGKFPPSGFLSKLTKFQENINISEFKDVGKK